MKGNVSICDSSDTRMTLLSYHFYALLAAFQSDSSVGDGILDLVIDLLRQSIGG